MKYNKKFFNQVLDRLGVDYVTSSGWDTYWRGFSGYIEPSRKRIKKGHDWLMPVGTIRFSDHWNIIKEDGKKTFQVYKFKNIRNNELGVAVNTGTSKGWKPICIINPKNQDEYNRRYFEDIMAKYILKNKNKKSHE